MGFFIRFYTTVKFLFLSWCSPFRGRSGPSLREWFPLSYLFFLAKERIAEN